MYGFFFYVFLCFLWFFCFFFFFFFFFQAEDGIRDSDMWLEFRRVLFRSHQRRQDMKSKVIKFLTWKLSPSDSCMWSQPYRLLPLKSYPWLVSLTFNTQWFLWSAVTKVLNQYFSGNIQVMTKTERVIHRNTITRPIIQLMGLFKNKALEQAWTIVRNIPTTDVLSH